MGGAACAAKILLCSPPVANRVAGVMSKAKAVAEVSLDYATIDEEKMSALQQAVCRCEALAEEIEKTCAGPLRACMDDVYKCEVKGEQLKSATPEAATRTEWMRGGLPDAPIDFKVLVNRFLAWPLPESVCADPCATTPGTPHRSGTTLLNAQEAEAMLRHVLAP